MRLHAASHKLPHIRYPTDLCFYFIRGRYSVFHKIKIQALSWISYNHVHMRGINGKKGIHNLAAFTSYSALFLRTPEMEISHGTEN